LAEIVVGDSRVRLTKVDRHHHVADWEPEPGTDYQVSLDGGEPIPDPRSPFQPDGVNGPSRVVDHLGYPWSDHQWKGVSWPASAIYELHVGTFTPEGTFAAAEAKFDHLIRLGIDVIEIMPVAEFPGRWGWGYDGVHLWAPRSAYGGPEGLKHFVDVAHGRGLAVILDVVYNHLGPIGNRLGEFGPYFTDVYTTPWGEAVNLDGSGCDGVRAHICENAQMWIRDYHLDGLRLDAVHEFLDTSANHILEELAGAVHWEGAKAGRSVVLIAESDKNDPHLVSDPQVGGFGLDAVWSDDFHHSLHALLTGERSGYYSDYGEAEDLAAAWAQNWTYDGCYSPARDRRHGRPAEHLDPAHFVVFLQNHDQIGNRARGERISQQSGLAAQRLGAAVTLLAPQVPLIFQGEEWGAITPFPYFTDHKDPALAAAVTEGRQREFKAFGWDPSDVADPQDERTFRSAVLDWEGLDQEPHGEMLAFYSGLIAQRRSLPRSSAGSAQAEVSGPHGQRLVFTRPGVMLAVDFSDQSVEIRGD